MKITESQLRRIIREEIEAVTRDKKKLIVQNDELGEHGGYDIDRPAIPGGKGSHDPGLDIGRVYDEGEDDFQKIRLARMKASGMSADDAVRASRSKLKHRGKHPGRG